MQLRNTMMNDSVKALQISELMHKQWCMLGMKSAAHLIALGTIIIAATVLVSLNPVAAILIISAAMLVRSILLKLASKYQMKENERVVQLSSVTRWSGSYIQRNQDNDSNDNDNIVHKDHTVILDQNDVAEIHNETTNQI